MVVSYIIAVIISVLGLIPVLLYPSLLTGFMFLLTLHHTISTVVYLYNTAAIMKWEGIDNITYQTVMTEGKIIPVDFTQSVPIPSNNLTQALEVLDGMKAFSNIVLRSIIGNYLLTLVTFVLFGIHISIPIAWLYATVLILMFIRHCITRYGTKWKSNLTDNDKFKLLKGAGTTLKGIALTKVNL